MVFRSFAVSTLAISQLVSCGAMALTDAVVDQALVGEIKACKGMKATISQADVEKKFEHKLFPGPFDSMGEFIQRTERWENFVHTQSMSCTRHRIAYTDHDTPSEVELSLKNVANAVTGLLKHDVVAQRTLLATAAKCSQKLSEIVKDGRAMSSVTLKDFSSMRGQSPDDQECLGLTKTLVPALEAKLKKMRVLMVVGADPNESIGVRDPAWGQRVRHDKAFSADLAGAFFPTVWKQNSNMRLRGLSPGELIEAKKMIYEVPPHLAREEYFRLLSNFPVLLFMDDKVTAERLAFAYAQMQKQVDQDLEKMIDGAPQELMMHIPYVEEAISSFPLSERGNACLIVSQIYKNLNRRYVKFPQAITQTGLVLSVFGGFQGVGMKQGASIASKRMGLTAMVYGGVVTKDTLTKYARGVAFCSVAVVENQFCDMEMTERLYKNGQEHVISSAISGSLLFGVGRILRAAAP